jgi:hypothetical protein
VKTVIYGSRNEVVGYLFETSNQVQVFDNENHMVGYYNKLNDITYRNNNYFGRGDQTGRILG